VEVEKKKKEGRRRVPKFRKIQLLKIWYPKRREKSMKTGSQVRGGEFKLAHKLHPFTHSIYLPPLSTIALSYC